MKASITLYTYYCQITKVTRGLYFALFYIFPPLTGNNKGEWLFQLWTPLSLECSPSRSLPDTISSSVLEISEYCAFQAGRWVRSTCGILYVCYFVCLLVCFNGFDFILLVSCFGLAIISRYSCQ